MSEAGKLVQLKKGVWIYSHHSNPAMVKPTVGILTTPSQTVLIDAGNSPKHALQIQAALTEMKAPPVSHIIYTHHHWDHTFGGIMFEGIFVGHEQCEGHLMQYKAINWSKEYFEREIALNPLQKASHQAKLEQIDDWNQFDIRLPDRTFSENMRLDLDGLTLELSYVGGPHANDSIIIKAVEANVLFVGDCFYPPPLALRKEGDSYSLDMLKRCSAASDQLYVHGHGQPIESDRFIEFIEMVEKGH